MSRTSMIGRMALAFLASATSPGAARHRSPRRPGHRRRWARLQLRTEVQRVALPLHRPAQADRAALPDVVKANNAFALDLYHAMRSQPGNFLVSPRA